MNYRKEIITKLDEMEKGNERIFDLAKGQLDLLDKTKAPKESYKALYNDIKEIKIDIQDSLERFSESHDMKFEPIKEHERNL